MVFYYNGEFIDQNRLKVSVTAPGFQYGYGVFTSLRTNQGKAILLAEHLNRLAESCVKIGVPFPKVDYHEIIEQLLVRNGFQDLRLKIIIFEDINSEASLLILVSEFMANRAFKQLTIISQNYEKTMLKEIKSLNYMENVLLHRKAVQAGFDEGLLTNSQNIICECCYANIFFVKQGSIYTPKANGNILNGIIRQQLIKSFPIIEKDIQLAELPTFEQVFITNSVQGVVYVEKIEQHSYDCHAISKLTEWSANLGLI